MTEFDFEQFERIIRHSFVQRALPVDRCSNILFSQLAYMPPYGGSNLPFQFVERETGYLEGHHGRTATKRAEPFSKNGILHGFMHKHFYVPGYDHLGVNALQAWKLNDPKSKKLDHLVSRVRKRYGELKNPDTVEEFSRELALGVVYGAGGVNERLSGSGTGDWIVYVTQEGKNYYLCIAKHGEDDFILETIKRCCVDFPFLSGLIKNRGSRT
jgi:hypothetical protein